MYLRHNASKADRDKGTHMYLRRNASKADRGDEHEVAVAHREPRPVPAVPLQVPPLCRHRRHARPPQAPRIGDAPRRGAAGYRRGSGRRGSARPPSPRGCCGQPRSARRQPQVKASGHQDCARGGGGASSRDSERDGKRGHGPHRETRRHVGPVERAPNRAGLVPYEPLHPFACLTSPQRCTNAATDAQDGGQYVASCSRRQS